MSITSPTENTGPNLPSSSPPPRPAVVVFRGVSKWYGNVIGLNNLTLEIEAGITGLLGPNGAGKSTLLQLATGQLRPSQGDVTVLGQRAWNNPRLNRWLGLCPEQDAFYEWMTGLDFVATCARLDGMTRREAREAANRSIEQVGMTHAMNRPIKGYSKGMRQRTKIAQALVHDPKVVFLDEPLTGTDPVARRDLMELIFKMGEEGRTVVVSSHVLREVEAVTSRIVLINRGRLVAEGMIRQIRDLIDTHPHRIVIHCPDSRALSAKLVRFEDVLGVELRRGRGELLVETNAPDAFYSRLPTLALETDTLITQLFSDDDNLEAVFRYLVDN